MNTKNDNIIDLMEYVKILWNNKRTIIKAIIIAIVCGIIVSNSIPKTYRVDVLLAPESGASNNNSSFSNMTSMLGIGSLGTVNQDALNSNMTPEIISSTPFMLEMYKIKLKKSDNDSTIYLYEYIQDLRKPWWSTISSLPFKAINVFTNIINGSKKIQETPDSINPYKLTSKQHSIISRIKTAITADIDKKKGITTISVTLQDPEITAIVADSAVNFLQRFITEYKIKKAKEDCIYLENICNDKKIQYYKLQDKYAHFMDMNKNLISQKTQAESTRLMNEMNIAYQVYSQVETQLQIAQTKMQEAKPVFATIEPASIPINPAGPNKFIILVGFIFLSIVLSFFWIIFGKDILVSFKKII